MNTVNLLPIIVSVLGILAGIISIIGWIITDVNEKKNERMVRESIIQNKTDPETAKILLAGSEKKTKMKKEDPYTTLQAGLSIMGLAVGYLLTLLLDIKQSDFGFWIMLIAGLGLGMLLTFFIKVKMEEKNKENSIEKNE